MSEPDLVERFTRRLLVRTGADTQRALDEAVALRDAHPWYGRAFYAAVIHGLELRQALEAQPWRY